MLCVSADFSTHDWIREYTVTLFLVKQFLLMLVENKYTF